MILQALTDHYQTLTQAGKLPALGWSQAKISFVLVLSPQGELTHVIDVREPQTSGKKTVLTPRLTELPSPVKRSSGVASNFLWDNSSYLLGVDDKGKPQRALECFATCKSLHESILAQTHTPAAETLLSFFRSWDPTLAPEHPALADHWEDILSASNLTFRCGGTDIDQDPEVRAAWERYYSRDGDGPQGVCLVTGEYGSIEAVHPSIKNVAGAQSSGAALVSFNAPAFCSYGKEQNFNAPTGKYAAFAYTAALNHLLADKEKVCRMGDTTVVYWARGGQDIYQMLYANTLQGTTSNRYSEGDLANVVKKLCDGEAVDFDGTRLDPNMDFYILGLSPNAARLSVRFFLHNTFRHFLRNLQAHQKRLSIVKPAFDAQKELPLWRLLAETVNQNARDKSPSPGLAGAVMRAILTNSQYPATLLNGVMLRITAEHRVTRGRAAIIKAYYLKNTHPDVPEEVLDVSLDTSCTYVPYVLGRLFSILESIQEAANPGINATITDKYFNSASATPGTVFPVLLDLSKKHLRKLDIRAKVYYEKQLLEVLDKLPPEFPARLNLPMKGSFQLGYYHQTQKRYTKKEEQ